MTMSENMRLNRDHALDELNAYKRARMEKRHEDAKYHETTIKLIYQSMQVNGWIPDRS